MSSWRATVRRTLYAMRLELRRIRPHDTSRTSAAAHEEYTRVWTHTLDRLLEYLESGGHSLQAAIDHVTGVLIEDAWAVLRPIYVCHGPPYGGAVPLEPALLLRHSASIYRRELLSMIPHDTETIIELGSGWGHNLFNLWLSGGRQDADYHALELTTVGRACTHLLASLEPRLRMHVAPFDYRAPVWPEAKGKTVVFTSFSLEQITHVPPDTLRGLAALPGLDRVIHLEPIGWQMVVEGHGTRVPLDAEREKYARRLEYSLDLYPTLRALEREGVLRIDEVRKDIDDLNPLNPTSVVVWAPPSQPVYQPITSPPISSR